MTEEIPMIPKATTMCIHSGNIINWNRLKRKPNTCSTDELCEIISKTLKMYLDSEDKTQLQYVTDLYRMNTENMMALDENERGDVKITVKVFLCTELPTDAIGLALDKVLKELEVQFVETLLLAISPSLGHEEEADECVTLDVLKPYWLAMEELVHQGRTLSIGICDLNKDTLETLVDWAKVKPCVNQVNLESCCIIPKDLTEYAKAAQIQLLTHNDRPEFITKERLQETIKEISTDSDSEAWVPQWVVRYSGILKCRGIIKMKGYVFHAVKDSNKKRSL